jgi:transposase
VDLTAIPGLSAQAVLTFFCEAGPQIIRFPSSKHFASWLGLCPDNRISGGKILSSKTRNVRCRLANALRMGATTLYRSHSAPGDYFRRLRARLGSPAAITAAAHKLVRILFAMLRDRRSFDPQLLASSTKGIFSAVKTPCANTPLLSALNLFLSTMLPIWFLRSSSECRPVEQSV